MAKFLNNTTTYTGAGGSGGSGSYTVSTSNGSGYYTMPSSTFSVSPVLTTSNNQLEVKGDANFEGDIKIKGKSLVDSLERIEARLAILRPNEELEEKWDKLRGLRQAYLELEAEIKEKEQIWKILKK